MKLIASTFLIFMLGFSMNAQVDTVTFSVHGAHEYSFFYSAYTSLFDRLDRPYIYSASMELGVVTFDISDIDNPVPVDTVTVAQLGGLNATNLYIANDRLYASLGGFQGISQSPGMAILNIDDPENLELVGIWFSTDYDQGCAVTHVEGNLAFLGGMDDGVITLDLSDEENPSFVSHILPFVDFPTPPGLFSVPNARGLDYVDPILYVCNDAGGLRAIDMTNPSLPVEVGMYMNTDLDEVAQPAYNNCSVHDNLCFVPVDYCGLDVVDITLPGNMTNAAWYNPWDCNVSNWDGRDGHSNQLVIRADLDLLFMSGADSELLVYDISDPYNAQVVGSYINLGDNIVAWGVDVHGSKIVLSYVNNPLGVPYDSNVGGIQILEWSYEGQSVRESDKIDHIRLYPVPAHGEVNLIVHKRLLGESMSVFNASGQQIERFVVTSDFIQLNVRNYSPGVYELQSSLGHSRRFVVD
jgi:hypothetical protein